MKKKGMISYALDPPNIVSLIGLFCAAAAIYAAILGKFQLGIVAAIWAVVFDWADGIVARRMKGRSNHQKAFGANLDSLIDIVSFGVFPGSIPEKNEHERSYNSRDFAKPTVPAWMLILHTASAGLVCKTVQNILLKACPAQYILS